MGFEDDLGELVEPPRKMAKTSAKYYDDPNTNWKKSLASLTVDDLISEKRGKEKSKLIAVEASQTIVEVLRTLAENSILSAPVMEGMSSSAKCLGFIDVLDIVGLAFKIIKEGDHTLHEFFSNPFFEKPIKDALAMSAFDDWAPVKGTTSLLEVLDIFTRERMFRPHRIPVVDVEGKMIDIISQSDIIKHAVENINTIGGGLDKTIEDLKIEHAVIAARDSAVTRDALSLLFDNRVHGIAVVQHPTCRLLSNFSASDLRGMTRNDLNLFDKTIIEFLDAMYAKEGAPKRKEVVTCKQHATLREIVTLLNTHKVHRVYVTDPAQRALGVVSMGDVITALRDM